VEGGKSKEEYGKVRKEKKAEEKQGKKKSPPICISGYATGHSGNSTECGQLVKNSETIRFWFQGASRTTESFGLGTEKFCLHIMGEWIDTIHRLQKKSFPVIANVEHFQQSRIPSKEESKALYNNLHHYINNSKLLFQRVFICVTGDSLPGTTKIRTPARPKSVTNSPLHAPHSHRNHYPQLRIRV